MGHNTKDDDDRPRYVARLSGASRCCAVRLRITGVALKYPVRNFEAVAQLVEQRTFNP